MGLGNSADRLGLAIVVLLHTRLAFCQQNHAKKQRSIEHRVAETVCASVAETASFQMGRNA